MNFYPGSSPVFNFKNTEVITQPNINKNFNLTKDDPAISPSKVSESR